MCFDMKNGKKNIFRWGNPGERLSECVEGVEIYKSNFFFKITYLKSFMQRIIQKRIFKLSAKSHSFNILCTIDVISRLTMRKKVTKSPAKSNVIFFLFMQQFQPLSRLPSIVTNE